MRLTRKLLLNNKYLSKIFITNVSSIKSNDYNKDLASSVSQRLLLETGLVRPTSGSGLFIMLPMMVKSIDRLSSIIIRHLSEVGAQKMITPCLSPAHLWHKTGRLPQHEILPEIIKVVDRHDKDYILCPTHEETLTDLMSLISPVSTKRLPLRLFQIGPKFRDEMRPRFGIIRAREFIMKDLYTFDVDKSSAENTYREISESYDKIFQEIGIPFMKVEGDNGSMGGSISHEYHYKCEIGEDRLLECNVCQYRVSEELLKNKNTFKCDHCSDYNPDQFKECLGMEVGHTFLLGDRYSSVLGAKSTNGDPLQMCCFGLGITRIIGAALESYSTETQLRWPLNIAPFKVCIIGPKLGSKESSADYLVENIYELLTHSCFKPEDVVIDDRNTFTIGKRLLEAKKIGYPFIIIVGKKAAVPENPQLELVTYSDETEVLSVDNVVNKINCLLK